MKHVDVYKTLTNIFILLLHHGQVIVFFCYYYKIMFLLVHCFQFQCAIPVHTEMKLASVHIITTQLQYH